MANTRLTSFLADVIDKKTGNALAIDSEASTREDFEKYLTSQGYQIDRIVPKRGNHRCGYCRSIARGSDDDVLCNGCRELFGHAFYHEL